MEILSRGTEKVDRILIRVKAVGLPPILVPPNFQLYIRPHDTKLKYKGRERQFLSPGWVDPHSIKKFDRLLMHRPESNQDYLKSLSLTGGPQSKKADILTDELTWQVIGLYIAEGNIRADRRTIQFTHGNHEEKYAVLVKKWGERCGINHSTVYGPGTCVVYLFSKVLADWFKENFGNGAYHKQIPNWLMEASQNNHLSLLEYYFRGDGCFWDESRGSIAATTRSQKLARQIQILLLGAGFAASQDMILDAGKPRYRVSVGGISAERLSVVWGVEIPKKGKGRSCRFNHIIINDNSEYVEFPVKAISSTFYKNKIANLEYEDVYSRYEPFVINRLHNKDN